VFCSAAFDILSIRMENCHGFEAGPLVDLLTGSVSALFHEIQSLCPQAYKHYRQNREN
jgi:hypothetical protein